MSTTAEHLKGFVKRFLQLPADALCPRSLQVNPGRRTPVINRSKPRRRDASPEPDLACGVRSMCLRRFGNQNCNR